MKPVNLKPAEDLRKVVTESKEIADSDKLPKNGIN